MMLTIDRDRSLLLVVDFQSRLMPAIENGACAVANARRLIDTATLLGIPVVFTEQNPGGLGHTVPELQPSQPVVERMTFDAVRTPGFMEHLQHRAIIVAGCEAHVCVLQTVLGLLGAGSEVFVVRDALGSRRAENKETAIRRMERHGAEIVTTEMVAFEWLVTCEHPRFRDVVAVIK